MGKFKLEHRECCRICGEKTNVTKLVSWSEIPLSADLLENISDWESEDTYPLDVYLCKNCGHVQLFDIIDSEIYENYLYTPSFSNEFEEYVLEFSQDILERFGKCNVVEIGCSDGILLKYLKEKSCRVLGFEPSVCLAERAERQYQVNIKNDYFSNNHETTSSICEHMGGKADLFIIRHVLEHLDDLDMMIAGIYENLCEKGSLVIEVPYLKYIVLENQFYAFFHEHLSYFSLQILNKLLCKHNFIITNVKTGKLEGGSIIVYASKDKQCCIDNSVNALLEEERNLLSIKEIDKFSGRVNINIQLISDFVRAEAAKGIKLAGWGAGQRAVTLLNACGLSSEEIQYIIDVNENYQNKYLPGCHIPVAGPERLKESPVDGIIVFATGYIDAIVNNNQDFLSSGGKFIKIIPTIEWLD